MTEKKTAIKLTAETESGTVAADLKRCIICQKLTPEPTTSTENGRKRVRDAASISEDVVSKRLKVMDFVYHMSNQYYRTYTMKVENTWKDQCKPTFNDEIVQPEYTATCVCVCTQNRRYLLPVLRHDTQLTDLNTNDSSPML